METIISIIISVLATYLVTWYFTKKQMKKNEITYFSINSYDVGKGLHDEFPSFQLNYKGEELHNEVHVLKGGFVNTGKDISNLKGDSELSIILPKDSTLKDIHIQKSNPRLEVDYKYDEKQSDIIDFCISGDFMQNEGFNFSAIIETTELLDPLFTVLELKYRIPNTNLKEEYTAQVYKPRKGLGFFFILAGMVMLFLCLILLNGQSVQYIVHEKNTNKEVELYQSFSSQLYISEKDSFFPLLSGKKITKEDFLENYRISPVEYHNAIILLSPLLPFLLSLLLFTFGISHISSFNKMVNVNKTLKLDNNKTDNDKKVLHE